MKVEFLLQDQVVLRLTKEELMLISNALNEVCHGLDLPEFFTRMGVEQEEVKKLLNNIGSIIDKLAAT